MLLPPTKYKANQLKHTQVTYCNFSKVCEKKKRKYEDNKTNSEGVYLSNGWGIQFKIEIGGALPRESSYHNRKTS